MRNRLMVSVFWLKLKMTLKITSNWSVVLLKYQFALINGQHWSWHIKFDIKIKKFSSWASFWYINYILTNCGHCIFSSSNIVILRDFGNHRLILKKVYINTKFENQLIYIEWFQNYFWCLIRNFFDVVFCLYPLN